VVQGSEATSGCAGPLTLGCHGHQQRQNGQVSQHGACRLVLADPMGDEMLKGFEWTKQMVRRIQSWMAAPTQFVLRL
jgi:hypothetical protein